VAIATAVLPASAGRATAEDVDQLSAASPRVAWDGGPFLVAAPDFGSGCVIGAEGPTCEHHIIDVDPTGMSTLVVELTARDASDLDLYLFDPDGKQVAQSASSEATEIIQLARPRAGRYTVSVSPWAIGDAIVVDPSMDAGRYDASATLVSNTYDVAQGGSCDGGVPSVGSLVPEGQLRVDVLVLLDKISLQRAESIVEGARVTYDDAGIDLYATFDTGFRVAATGTTIDAQGHERPSIDSETMFAAARAYVGGAPPPGVEAVLVLTRKDLNDFGSDYAGIASCIGALSNTSQSFALAEAWADERTTPLGLYQPDFSPLVFAHELGHLLNAQHHYGECTFGVGRADQGDVGTESCTLMQYVNPQVTRTLTTSSMYFSVLNRAVVRSHVAAYAVE